MEFSMEGEGPPALHPLTENHSALKSLAELEGTPQGPPPPEEKLLSSF